MKQKLSRRLPNISKRAKVKSDKPAYKEKKKTDKGYVWVYDEKHVEKRWKEKKEKMKSLEKNLQKVRKKYQDDLTSDNDKTRATAAIVGIMDDTAMRIGNEESAKEGTFGATTLKVKHVKGGTGNMTFDFPGKGAIEQNVVLKNNKVIKVIRDLMKGKKANDFIFEIDGKKIWDRTVNRYLKEFGISAKDLRGFHANRLMKEQLKKKDFKDALKEVAEIVGHEEATLKNQYLDPELVEKHEGKEKEKKEKEKTKKDKKKKKAGLSIRAEETLPIGSVPEESKEPIYIGPQQKQQLLSVNPNKNVGNIDTKNDNTNPDLGAAWRILAPFLPDGATWTSGVRDDNKQAQTILEFWLSKWWDRDDVYDAGFFQTNYKQGKFKVPFRIHRSILRRIHTKAKNGLELSKDDLWWVEQVRQIMTSYGGGIPGGPKTALRLAMVGESAHRFGTALDIANARLEDIQNAVSYVSSVFPENIHVTNIVNEPGNRAVHVEIGSRVLMPNMDEFMAALRHFQSGAQLSKRQSYRPKISKRAELTPQDTKWVENVLRQRGVVPSKYMQNEDIMDISGQEKQSMRIRPKVKLTPAILDAWKLVEPFLPKGTVMTSGARTQQDQVQILKNYWRKATGRDLPPYFGNLSPNSKSWLQVSQLLKRHHGLNVGPPYTKRPDAHIKGRSFDISGASLNEMAHVIRVLSRDTDLPVRLTALVEDENNAVHVNVKDVAFSDKALALVKKKYRVASSMSQRDSGLEKYSAQIDGIYEDLVLSNPPQDIADAFDLDKRAYYDGEFLADDGDDLELDMGFGKEDALGDWFEKSPIFRWREDIPEFDIHDVGDAEAKKLAEDDPEKFFYRGLHKDYPDLESVALKGMLKDNAKFFFIFLYHEREEDEFKNLAEEAAEALSLQDARAFFYYHLHHKFPELGRGAIVQLIDINPDSFFDFGLQKDYPDLEESAGAARNIKDPNKVELEQPEWLKRDTEQAISLRDRNASKKISKRAGEVMGFSHISRKIIEELRNLPGSFDIREEESIAHVSGEIPIREEPKMSVIWTYTSTVDRGGSAKVSLNMQDGILSKYQEIFSTQSKKQEEVFSALKKFLDNVGDKAVEVAKKTMPGLFDDNVVPLFKQQSRLISKRAEEPKIELTEEEKKVLNVFNETVRQFKLGTTVRVAGGWVRDKIMGRESKDIDVAVDNMMGKEFSKYVERYARSKGIPVSVGVIPAKPEQGKNLETAVIHMFDQEIEVVNLRDEEYDEVSRRPVTTITDSPVKDAFRRDLTINSLFYNVNTGEVEDFTGDGINDIHEGVIRTPTTSPENEEEVGREITPKAIFMDDPLRVLRAIRFANRYGFEIKDDLAEAAKDTEVQEAFRKKITWERRQDELRKIMSERKSPRQALEIIKDWGYRSELLQLPDNYSEWDMDQNNPYHELNVWNHLMEALDNIYAITKSLDISKAEIYVLNWAALLHDIGKLDPRVQGTKQVGDKIQSTFHGHEESSIRAAEYLLRQLKGTRNEEIKRIQTLIDAARRMNPQHQDPTEQSSMSRKSLGKILQITKDFENDWERAMEVAIADSAAHKEGWMSEYPMNYWESLKGKFREMPKETATMGPILSGNEMMQMFGRKGGPWLGQINKALIEWQMESPEATKEQAAEFARQYYVKQGLDKIAKLISKRADNDLEKRLVSFPGTITLYRPGIEYGGEFEVPTELGAKVYWEVGSSEDYDSDVTAMAELMVGDKGYDLMEQSDFDSFDVAVDAIENALFNGLPGALRAAEQSNEVFHADDKKSLSSRDNALISKRAKKDKPKAGVFMKLPRELSKQFPSLGEHDDSVPHVTTLFIGLVPEEHEILLEEIVRRVAMEHDPFELSLDEKVSYFPATKHSDDCKVAKLSVVSDGLRKLHKALKKALINAEMHVDDHFPDYKPHVTLEYMAPPKEKYDTEIPSGSWTADKIEIWNGDKKTTIPLGRKG